MDELSFDDESLDAIWSEGAIYNIGFEHGVHTWRRFPKPGGILGVSRAHLAHPPAPARTRRPLGERRAVLPPINATVRSSEGAGCSGRGQPHANLGPGE